MKLCLVPTTVPPSLYHSVIFTTTVPPGKVDQMKHIGAEITSIITNNTKCKCKSHDSVGGKKVTL